MPATEVQYRYFALDSDHALTTTPLELSIDGGTTFVTATSTTAPSTAASLAVPSGLTRYWWRLLMGPGQSLVPPDGRVTVTGRLIDTPEVIRPTWTIYV